MRDRGNANRGAGGSNARRQSVDERVLEAARWPEQDPLWDIEKWDELNRIEPAVSFVRDEEEPPHQTADIAKWEEANTSDQAPLGSQAETNELEQIRFVTSRNETSESSPQPIQPERSEPEQTRVVTSWEADASSSSLRPPFHTHQDKSESANTAWIAGAIIAGLLVIGGGIYAYENWITRAPVPAPIPAETAPTSEIPNASPSPAMPAPPAVPDIRPAPQVPPQGVSPVPNRAANGSNSRLPRAVPPQDDPIDAPMTLTPETAPPPQGSAPASPALTQQPAGDSIVRPSSEAAPAVADDPINAPMTLTPETAPPPQPATSPGRPGSQ